MHKKIKNSVNDLFDQLVDWRNYLHSNPELSFQEYNTVNFVASKLDEFGISYQKGIAETGLVAIIEGKNPKKKCIALRADLDALPIQEENDCTYKSTVNGVMHACGHDVHTTCLLGAAKVLSECKEEFEGTIKLIFQPGEELLPGGASIMIKEGVLKNPTVDNIIALHVYPSMEVGKVGFRSGKYMASCDELYLRVNGKGGHAAIPHQYVNPVLIIAELLPKLDAFVKSIISSEDNVIFAFGKLNANGATNVIPACATAEGTLRTMNEQQRTLIHRKLKDFVEEYLQSKKVTGQIEIKKGYPFLKNDSFLTEHSFALAVKYLGSENVEQLPIRMTAEDFSFYSQKIPACFFRLGVRNESLGIVHGVHHPKFDIDSKALKVGSGLLAYLAMNT